MLFAYSSPVFWFVIAFIAVAIYLASATLYRWFQKKLNILTAGIHSLKLPRLQLKILSQSSSNVMAVSKDNISFNDISQEELFVLVITVLDRDSDKPVLLFVDIYEQGMELQPSTCYLTTSVNRKRKKPNTKTKNKLYNVRIHENSIMGQAKLIFCFSESNTEYNITIKIHSIVDDNGVEVTNDYRIKGDTCSVLTFDRQMYYTAPQKDLPLIELVAPLKGKRYLQFMETLTKFTVSRNSQKLIEIAESLSKSTRMPYDFIPIVYICLGLSSVFNGNQSYEDSMIAFSHALELSAKCECVNCCLIEGTVYIYMAQVNRHFKRHEKSYENTQKAKIKFFNVMPCHDTSMVYFQEALLRLDKADFKLTAETKKKVLSDIDMWANHTKKSEDYRSLSLFSYSLIFKAQFHLNIIQGWLLLKDQTEIEVPQLTEEDLREAKASLDAVPEEFLEKHKPSDYKVEYYFVLSEYYRLSGNTKLAQKHFKLTERKTKWGNSAFNTKLIRTRLEMLSDAQDHSDSDEEWAEILDEY